MLRVSLVIRTARKPDAAAIFEVERRAFGREDEARLALALMESPVPTISLVAEWDRKIVGHVLMSEIGAPVRAVALAPLAVLPQYREMLIGSRLVAEALARSRKAGYEAVFVLGDNLYYERFGFSSPLAESFEVGWQGPHFMALELVPGALGGRAGKLSYPAVFSDY